MKVKMLEWRVVNHNYTKDLNDIYEIYTEYKSALGKFNHLAKTNVPVYPNENVIIVQPTLGNFQFLDEAKQACQSHYDSFILSQIEEPKAFDPELIGFKECDTGIEDNFRQYELLNSDSIELYYVPKSNSYTLIDHSKPEAEEHLFVDIKIPDHDFGVKLISQFLEVE